MQRAPLREPDRVIGALLRTQQAVLTAPSAIARAAEVPYDPLRSELFANIYAALASWPVIPRPDAVLEGSAFANVAFIDAYFSNFIEGTEFEIEEAIEIVFKIASPAPTRRTPMIYWVFSAGRKS